MLAEDSRGGWGYEMKFLAPHLKAEQVLAWARQNLALQRDAAQDQAGELPVHISSLYFDTPDLDIYHRVGKQGRRKYRARRYGEAPTISLERKTKAKGQVSERRCAIAWDELSRLADWEAMPGWEADWFHRDLLRWHLEPVCRLEYERLSFAGTLEEQPVRLCIDRHVCCTPASLASLEGAEGAHDLMRPVCVVDGSIVEVRVAEGLPASLKALLRDLHLTPRGLSKYRLAVEACLLAGVPGASLGGGAYGR